MRFVLVILISVFLVGPVVSCKKNPVREYGRGLIQTLDKADGAAAVANLEAMKKSISSFHMLNDRYPDDLGELAAQMGLDPGDFTYDSETGKVGLW